MTTTTQAPPIDADVPRGWPALFAALPPTDSDIDVRMVSCEVLGFSQGRILSVIGDLTRLSQSINAYASDDAFDLRNAADFAIEDLRLVLAALAGGAS